MKRLLKSLVACIVIVASIVTAPVSAKADEEQYAIVESTDKKQYTNMYSYYTSIEVVKGIWPWSKREKWFCSARFNSADKIMIRKLAGSYRWEGKEAYVPYMEIKYAKKVSIKSMDSVSITGKLGLKVPVYVSEVSGEIGGEYFSSKEFSKEEIEEINTKLTKEDSPAGWYTLMAIVDADLYDVKLEHNDTVKKGKLYKIATKEPYVQFVRTDKSY